MKQVFSVLLLILVAVSSSSCYKKINVGHTGIRVNKYGSEKGVDPATEVTGIVWYAPWKYDVYEMPNTVWNVFWDENREFRVSTQDGAVIRFDVGMNASVPADNSIPVFVKYFERIEHLRNSVWRDKAQKAFNHVASFYTVDSLINYRAEYEKQAVAMATELLEAEGLDVDDLFISKDLRYPDEIDHAIRQKIKAKQETEEAEERARKAEAQARERINTASGKAESMRIMAEAEAQAYAIKKRELNDLLIKQQWIEKWDGELPVYGEMPLLYQDVQK